MTRRHTWTIFFLSLAIMILQISCGDDDDSTSSSSSVPGENWIIRATGTSNYMMDVACSGSRFAATGQGDHRSGAEQILMLPSSLSEIRGMRAATS